MIIKQQNNEAIIKQLTELLNNSFDDSINRTLENYDSVRTIKQKTQEENEVNEAIILVKFINYWVDNTYRCSLTKYAALMKDSDYGRFIRLFNRNSYTNFVNNELHNKLSYKEKGESPFLDETIIPLLIRVKQHNNSIEESLLAVVKPFLVEEFVSSLTINELETTLELLSIVNHYNDYDYQLERFISVFEENLLKKEEHKRPLELMGVWWIDETFLKNTIIPGLKKRTLTNDQKQAAAIDSNCLELVNNYYDYCLYYAFAEDYDSVSTDLVKTLFFYEKEDYDKAISIIKSALWINESLDETAVLEERYWLLYTIAKNKPEWVDQLLLL